MTVDVVVVGAGAAGLTAAWRLAQGGADVLVLEARDRVGGRLLTETVDGVAFELGGQWIAPYQHAARGMIDELGLELFARHRTGEDVYVAHDGRVVRHGGEGHHAGAPAHAAYQAAVARLAALVAELDPEAPWEHPDAAALDALPFSAWLEQAVADPDARDSVAFVATGFMTKPAHTFSLLQAVWLLASADGDVVNLLDPDLVLDARVVGGLQRVPLGLAERLGERVRLGVPVRDCRWDEDGVVLRTGGAGGGLEVAARFAVLALPANLMAAVAFDPPLPAWRMRADQDCSQGSLIKVQAAYPEPFWRADGLSGTGFGVHEVVSELYDNSPPDGVPGVAIGFVAGTAAEALTRLPAEERRARVLASFARYLGPRALEPTHYVECDWNADPWTRGAYAATFGVGGLSRFGADIRRPIGPLRFAGTDVAGTGTMHVDGAIRSGAAAADAVLGELAAAR